MNEELREEPIEIFAIELLKSLGYQYIYAPKISPGSDNPLRKTFSDILLIDNLKRAIDLINPTIPYEARADTIKEIERINSSDLLTDNETFHRMLTEGIKVSYSKDNSERGDLVWLIDFNNIEKNEFIVMNQFTIVEDGNEFRPDLILFINGIPLVIFELKNPTDEKATIFNAYNQLQTYKDQIPSLFTYNSIMIISDGLEAKAGSLSAGFSRFMNWKSLDGKVEASNLISQIEVLINGMLNKETLLDLVRHFIVFEKEESEDLNTDIITISTVKKLAAYHQYYAVNRAIESTLRATGVIDENKIVPPLKWENFLKSRDSKIEVKNKFNDKKAGVVWHTQGSGKSLSMVFYTGKIVLLLDNPTIIMITDRNDLDDQLFNTFASSKQLLRQTPIQAKNILHLKKLLKVVSGGVIFTTIQKFQPEASKTALSYRNNIVVIADEAHRTQYGFKPKSVDKFDNNRNLIGKEDKYGFAKYMRDALPNATYLGFTGTPIEGTDINTPRIFGNYIDIYDIAQAVADGATVPIYYESRLVDIRFSEEGKKLINDLDKELKTELSDSEASKAKWTKLEALVGNKNRIKRVAKDIVEHFSKREEVFSGKAMIVSISRRVAAELYEEIITLKPSWHSNDLKKGFLKVVMTSNSSDGVLISRHHTTKNERKILANRMRNPNDKLTLVIVVDMWLTGFDAPTLHTMYIDKPMRGHNLMQAIARVNRVYKDKPGGLIVDYLGIASDLKKALKFYSDSGGKGDPTLEQDQAVAIILEKVEIISNMFHGFSYEDYFESDTAKKLSTILGAENHILGLDNGKKRFIDEVLGLSKAFAIAVPHEQAMDLKDEISFFQAVKARLVKFEITKSGKTKEEIDSTIRQVIDKALVSEKVIDIFDAAGIQKPNISILSEDFLLELKGMLHKNIALEVLKKILTGEIHSRKKKNLVKSKSLMEMLQNAINRYNNKIITAAEIMEELIDLSKEITNMDNEAKELGLTDYEYAFYTAVADNDSAKELMKKDILRELAIVLTQKVRENASIDWTIKENVRAKLKVIIKRTLRKYGYPPDMQKLATEIVLEQAELIAKELNN